MAPQSPVRRSAKWFEPQDVFGFIHRGALRSEGLTAEAVAGRPVVGICNAWSELVNCNLHLRGLAEATKRGIWQAGGVPLEFPSMSLSEILSKPSTMLYRNLGAMEVEETIRSSPLDAVVLLAGCDKSVPAQLMGAASADLPAIMLTGGPRLAGHFRGERVGAGTNLWRHSEDYRMGRMSDRDFAELESSLSPSVGHCSEMGTASTMAAVVEALGITVSGAATTPAVTAKRVALAEATGRAAVELADSDRFPSRIMTRDSFHNAITVLTALGGSTNAVLHLLALARRVGVDLSLDDFDRIAAETPIIADVQPVGTGLFEDLDRAGGIPALMRELGDLVRPEATTVTGESVGSRVVEAENYAPEIIRPLDKPVGARGGLVALRGSLAPSGAVLKAGAMSDRFRRHRGKAVVFDGIEDLLARIDDPDLEVDADSVLVLRGCGPKGAPGMPEWGMLPIPRKLVEAGVSDMLRISDARMSGTGYGSVVLHVAPESAVGGPLAIVRDGDEIAIDVDARSLDLLVSPDEVTRRLEGWEAPPLDDRGFLHIHRQYVLQADQGADFDRFESSAERKSGPVDPPGLLRGWVTGW